MNPMKRPSGSTLDAGNTALLAKLWLELINVAHPAIEGLEANLTDKKSAGYKVFRDNDKNLQIMMRTWLQSSKLVHNEIMIRIKEIEELTKQQQAVTVVASIEENTAVTGTAHVDLSGKES